MKLSNQAIATFMIILQKALATQTDIVPMFRSLDFEETADGRLIVLDPPNMIEVINHSVALEKESLMRESCDCDSESKCENCNCESKEED